jgi:hypothetical protein
LRHWIGAKPEHDTGIPVADETSSDVLSTDQLMKELRREIRAQQLLGEDEKVDPKALAGILLKEAIERYELKDEYLIEPREMELHTYLRVESHRPIIGKPLVFLKRTFILPVFRWLLEYSIDNFRRQQAINNFQSACLRVLVLENERLRRDLEKLKNGDD